MTEERMIRVCVSVLIPFTAEEAASVFENDGDGYSVELGDIVKRAIADGRHKLNGRAYIPYDEVRSYNADYADEDDMEWEEQDYETIIA